MASSGTPVRALARFGVHFSASFWNSSRPTAAFPRYSQSKRPSRKRTWAKA